MTLSIAVRHTFPGAEIGQDMAIEAPTPGICALFGPSGAGKSTLIAAVAGLLRPCHCRIEVDGEVLADTGKGVWLPPERRRVGLVFQDSRLFPHMSVAGNLRFGLRRARTDGRGRIAFETVVELLGIEKLLARRPHTLSGGERQRVAIGRALLAQPRLLLMDEPLANLDPSRREEILRYLAQLKTALALPILYVTHALDEVARLADTLVLLERGRVLAAGPLSEVLSRADLSPAARDDAASVLDVEVVGHDTARELTRLRTGADMLVVPLIAAPPGQFLRARIPAREVVLARADAAGMIDALSPNNVVRGTVRAIDRDRVPHTALVEIALSAGAMLSSITPDSVARLGLAPGVPVLAIMKSTAIEVLGFSRQTSASPRAHG